VTLLAAMEAYCRQHGVTEAQLGKLTAGSTTFMQKLRRGMRPTDTKQQHVRRFMGEHKEGLPLSSVALGADWIVEQMARRAARD